MARVEVEVDQVEPFYGNKIERFQTNRDRHEHKCKRKDIMIKAESSDSEEKHG